MKFWCCPCQLDGLIMHYTLHFNKWSLQSSRILYGGRVQLVEHCFAKEIIEKWKINKILSYIFTIHLCEWLIHRLQCAKINVSSSNAYKTHHTLCWQTSIPIDDYLYIIYIYFNYSNQFQLVIVGVWLTSALYSTPRFIFSRTITNIHSNGISEEICIMNRKLFNSKLLDFINFLALYALPLLVMTVSIGWSSHTLFVWDFLQVYELLTLNSIITYMEIGWYFSFPCSLICISDSVLMKDFLVQTNIVME